MSSFQNDSIFWVEVEKIKPNPYQPRKEFDQEKLKYLSESIRQYGVLQPLVVTRHEVQKDDGGLKTEYELIAGERRLRASKMAGLQQVPVIIRTEEDDAGAKLELAIIENLQREDLNPMDRAFAFHQLAEEFGFKHNEIAKKVGKSREYVSNTIRLLLLPEEMRNAVSSGRITEGHSRPILMLKDRPEEQLTLFKEILLKRLTVRDAESIARKVAVERVRRKDYNFDPEIAELEEQFAESLGTRVQIEKKQVGGKLTIDFFSNDDLKKILDLVHSNGGKKSSSEMLDNFIKSNGILEKIGLSSKTKNTDEKLELKNLNSFASEPINTSINMNEDVVRATEDVEEENEDLNNEVAEDIMERNSAEKIEEINGDTFEKEISTEETEGNKSGLTHGDSTEEKPRAFVGFEENNSNEPEKNKISSELENNNNYQEKLPENKQNQNLNNQNQNQNKEEKSDDDSLYSLKDFSI
ncbi:ParB/RepB/Spo0J family partition protein [Patescibacteria group bacterium]|nr:ParB/RepB/Spo0J family partition protein [Patescibacteria group bacterium]MCG2694975.1 ParB/RepB/Spo0J family partition protein [Candidatus Parcubacteria bacterium]